MKFCFPFDISDLLDLSVHVYWKNEAGVYLGCNEFMAYNLGLPKTSAIIGLRDTQTIVSKTSTEIYQGQDKEILLLNQSRVYLDSGEYSNKMLVFTTIKYPLRDQQGNPRGVLGISIPIQQENFRKVVSCLSNSTLNEFANMLSPYKLSIAHRQLQIFETLSKREKQCLFYLIRGFSVRVIAEKLGLSKRTAEDYVENVKNKLGCQCKRELIELVLDYYGLGEILCE